MNHPLMSWSREKWRAAAVLALLLLAYSAAVGVHLAPRRSVENLDFWYHLSVGQRLDWAEPATLVDGLYPVGYPYLLRLATAHGLDALRAGQFLSWAGGLLALGALFILVYGLTGSGSVAAGSALLLLTNGHFLAYASCEGNDLLAAGLQAASVAALWAGLARAPGARPGPWLALGSGLLGLAYLTRYSALILLPVVLVCALVRFRRSRRALLLAVALTLLPFLAVTAVQWVPSWLVYRTPVYTLQAKNVWFGIYGQNDWVNNWGRVPDTISLRDVIALDPGRFFGHWLGQLGSALTANRLWPWPLHAAWIVALPALLVARHPRPRGRLLLVLAAVAPLIVTALAWLGPRFLLLPLWMEAALIAWLAARLARRLPLSGRTRLLPAAAALAVLAVVLQGPAVRGWLRAAPVAHPPAVNALLRDAGMGQAARVATNDPYLHAADEPARTRYAQTYWVDSSPASVEALLATPAAAAWQFLVLDYAGGLGDYAPLREAFRHAQDYVAPLVLSDRRDIFCVLPCALAGTRPLDFHFGPGMRLVGYWAHGTAREGSVYLYWRADRPMRQSFKVSVRVLSAAGAIVFQQDDVPALWTRPTTQWRVGDRVVDFYRWRLDRECVACSLAVLVYDEKTLVPVTPATQAGEPLDPLVLLGPLPH